MPDLTEAGLAAYSRRFRAASEAARKVAEIAANAYLQRQAEIQSRSKLTPFKPGPASQFGLLAQAQPLIKPIEPLVKSESIFKARPLVEAQPLVEKQTPPTKRGEWKPSPAQLREALRLGHEAFSRELSKRMRG